MTADIPDGILVIDKPAGMTSAQAVAHVKRGLGVAKIGHAGTLDPFATGVMICCLNKATRLAGFFLHGSKTYDAVLHLGVETDTLDCTGKVVAESGQILHDGDAVNAVICQFKGKIQQAPPVYSALKHRGVPLYRLAREGKPVQKPPREVIIYDISATEIRIPEVRIHVACSGGTYIRSLAADIGKKLGCGAHLKKLRRTESGGFKIRDAVSLSEIGSGMPRESVIRRIIPMADALTDMDCCEADDDLAEKIRCGRSVAGKDLNRQSGHHHHAFVKVIRQHSLIAVLHYENEQYGYCCVFN